jgi:hypothetical protein
VALARGFFQICAPKSMVKFIRMRDPHKFNLVECSWEHIFEKGRMLLLRAWLNSFGGVILTNLTWWNAFEGIFLTGVGLI